MSKKDIILTALFKAKEGKEKSLKNELMALITPTRSEKGCLQYDLYQYSDSPESFLFYERWENEECLSLHKESDHLKKCIQNIKEFVSERPQVRFLEQI